VWTPGNPCINNIPPGRSSEAVMDSFEMAREYKEFARRSPDTPTS
jgi:hypothetical protein